MPITQMTSGDTTSYGKLRLWRKTNRPNYYSAEAEDLVPISRNTEDAMILTTAETKQQAVSFLKGITNNDESSDDYNTLLDEFLTQQVANSEAALVEMAQLTGNFDSFRYSAMQDPDNSNTISNGMSPPVNAMTKGMGRLSAKSRRERFHKLFDTVSQVQFVKDSTSSIKKECRSWIKIFLAYPV